MDQAHELTVAAELTSHKNQMVVGVFNVFHREKESQKLVNSSNDANANGGEMKSLEFKLRREVGSVVGNLHLCLEVKGSTYGLAIFTQSLNLFDVIGVVSTAAFRYVPSLLKSFAQMEPQGALGATNLLRPFSEIVDSLGLKDPFFIRNWIDLLSFLLAGVKSNGILSAEMWYSGGQYDYVQIRAIRCDSPCALSTCEATCAIPCRSCPRLVCLDNFGYQQLGVKEQELRVYINVGFTSPLQIELSNQGMVIVESNSFEALHLINEFLDQNKKLLDIVLDCKRL
ncbi:hypothetical protein LguiB_001512 [Lonicera macranthoides]